MYIFELGRDGDISTLELIRVLSSITGKLPDIIRHENYVILNEQLNDEEELETDYLANRLGGTLKIGKVFFTSETIDQNFINSLEFYYPKSFELYVTSDKTETAEAVVNELNIFKKKNKLRGSIVIPDPNKIKPFAGEYEMVKDKIGEILVIRVDNIYHFALVEAYSDPNEFKFKDEARPVQKFTHGTSFRLAKMMVNILDMEPGKTMVDPFCGIGTFLIEGLLADYDVIGIDYDPEVISGARKNVEWAKEVFNVYGKSEIVNADSRTHNFKADGCVFEPYMGPFMKRLPYLDEVMKVVYGLENLYSAVFKNLQRSLPSGGPVVCIIPYFQTIEGEIIKINERVFSDNGFESIIDPIEYNTPDGSKILRNLWLLQKS